MQVRRYLPEWCSVVEGLVLEAAETPTDLNAIQSAIASLRCLSTLFSSKDQTVENIAFSCLRSTVETCLEVHYLTSSILHSNDQ